MSLQKKIDQILAGLIIRLSAPILKYAVLIEIAFPMKLTGLISNLEKILD